MASNFHRPRGSQAQHGTISRHEGGCRCDLCTTAKARYDKGRSMGYRRTTASYGTTRRLQALARMGWGLAEIEKATGIDETTISVWRRGKWPTVYARGAEQIAALYERLWNTPGPSVRTASRAANKGWRMPMDWEGYIDAEVLPFALRKEHSTPIEE